MSGTSRPVWLFRFLQKLKYQCLYWSSTNYNRKLCPGFDPDMCRIRKEWVLESRFVYFRFRVSWDFLKNWVPWGPQFLKNWVPFGSLNGTFKGPMSIWEHWYYSCSSSGSFNNYDTVVQNYLFWGFFLPWKDFDGYLRHWLIGTF